MDNKLFRCVIDKNGMFVGFIGGFSILDLNEKIKKNNLNVKGRILFKHYGKAKEEVIMY